MERKEYDASSKHEMALFFSPFTYHIVIITLMADVHCTHAERDRSQRG